MKEKFVIFIFLFVILFFLRLSLCLVLFNSFCHLSLQTFLFHSFEISFRCDIVLFSVLPLLFLPFAVFHFSKLLFRCCFCLYYVFHSFIRTNMHDKGTKRNDNANEPSLCSAVAALGCSACNVYSTDRNH